MTTRRRRVVLGVGIWVLGLGISYAQRPTEITYARVGRLKEWVAAVEQHQLGVDDAAVAEIRSWPAGDLFRVRGNLRGVAQLIRDMRSTFFQPEPTPGSEGKTVKPVLFHPSDIGAFREVAQAVENSGGFNRLLKRGALLHTDIAMVGGSVAASSGDTGAGFTLRFKDGRQSGFEEVHSHWDFARRLLDGVFRDPMRNVTSDPSSDADVRHWYQATMAVLIEGQQHLIEHFDEGVAIFPGDAEILSFAGTLHARLASAPVQSVVQAARLPAGARLNVGSERDELRLAESLYRRSLAANPRHAETRLRFGRVLALLGRPADAIPELTAALADTADPLLRYYALLSLGDAAESAGDLSRARQAYADARALFPRAQSARLALSHLANRDGDRRAALVELQAAMALANGPDAEDPWWTYHVAAGRDADMRLEAVYEAIDPGSQR